jgi:hypothetical protein
VKTISGALSTLFASPAAGTVAFVELQFTSGTNRFCTAGQSMEWDGFTWTGVGALASIEPIRETASTEANGLRLFLNGVSTALISLALSEQVQGRPAKMWVAGVDSSGAVVATPVLEFQGRIDTLFINDKTGGASIGVNVESKMSDYQRSNVRRFNDATQQADYPGDKFFSFVAPMVETQLVWPSKEFFK